MVVVILLLAFTLPSYGQISRSGATISNGVLSVTQSDTWGGAVMSFKYKGEEFINVNDPGRLLQYSTYGKDFTQFVSDGYLFSASKRVVINPNQGGDAIRGESEVLFLRTEGPDRVVAKCIPREWFVRQWPGLLEHGGAAFDTSRFIASTTFLEGYGGQVAQIDLRFLTPRGANWNAEIPALYMEKKFGKYYGFDAIRNLSQIIINTSSSRVVHRVNIGGVMASTSTDGPTIGIYGANRSYGGDLDNNFIGLTRTFGDTTKLGAESGRYWIDGGVYEYYTTYIVAGSSPTEVQSIMRQLYLDGYRGGPHATSLNREIAAVGYDDESHPGDLSNTHPIASELQFIKNGNWVRYSDIDFGEGAGFFTVTAKDGGVGGTIEVRLDALDGPVLAIFEVPSDFPGTSIETLSAILSQPVSGMHDVYLRFSGGAGITLFNLKAFAVRNVLWEDNAFLGRLAHYPDGWSYWIPEATGWGYIYLIDRDESGQGWIYHSQQGWIYFWPGSVISGGVWAWSQASGYMYVSSAYGPNFYHFDSNSMRPWVE